MTFADAATLVLVHGLGRTKRAMTALARAGRRRGYQVLNFGYPSRRSGIEENAALLAECIRRDAERGVIHFVTHSLGGIIVRHAVASEKIPAARLGRVVMLAPPNAGSEIADAFTQTPGLRRVGPVLLGPALTQLGTSATALVNRLPPVPFECGVIAGTRSLNPLFSALIDGPSDGKVGVARAEVPGMRDFLEVPHSHTFLMSAPAVIDQTFAFLEHGRFAR
jgi:triacylglycerol lipase